MANTIGPILLGIVLLAGPAFSEDAASGDQSVAADLTIAAVPLAPSAPQPAVTPLQPPVLPVPHYYSRAYDVRAKIHKYASLVTLPLVGGEFAVGQSLFDSPSDWKKSTHVALGTAIGGLFAVNSVTGVWNLVEARKDPNRGHLPLIHSLLALGADAGFVATAAITPGNDHDGGSVNANNRSTHRTMAFTSMGLATASYLVMLIGNR
jgi:hypothetical protein